jgi:hypothetical protein
MKSIKSVRHEARGKFNNKIKEKGVRHGGTRAFPLPDGFACAACSANLSRLSFYEGGSLPVTREAVPWALKAVIDPDLAESAAGESFQGF